MVRRTLFALALLLLGARPAPGLSPSNGSAAAAEVGAVPSPRSSAPLASVGADLRAALGWGHARRSDPRITRDARSEARRTAAGSANHAGTQARPEVGPYRWRPPSAAAGTTQTAAGGGRAPREDWRQVDVAPTKTSIYIGSVTMTMPTFTRGEGVYSAPYTAKVFPYFFYNESGTLTVDVSDAQLAELAAGQPIEITGTAVRTDGAHRKVTAKATPADSRHGKLDVHVYVSKRIKLIFHTTYAFR